MRARVLQVLIVVALVAGVGVVTATSSPAVDDLSLWVSPNAPGGADTKCADAGYTSVQAAVDAAAPDGATVNVCPGVYEETVDVAGTLNQVPGRLNKRNLTLRGVTPGTAVLRPAAPSGGYSFRSAPDSSVVEAVSPVLIAGSPETGRTTVRDLVVDGRDAPGSTGVYVIAEQNIGPGVLATNVRLQGLIIHDVTDGVRVDNKAPAIPMASSVTLINSTVTGYTGVGVRCAKFAVVCSVRGNRILGSDAEVGVIVHQGARATVSGNTIAGNTVGGYGAGVVLEAAGINLDDGSPPAVASLSPSTVSANSIIDNAAGVRVYQSRASITRNVITTGVDGSVGVSGLGVVVQGTLLVGRPAEYYATADQPVAVVGNTILFAGAIPGDTTGISLGDTSAIGGGTPSWSQKVTMTGNTVVNAAIPTYLGPAAHT